MEAAIEEHLQVLSWEKAECLAVGERLGEIRARELQVLEQRLTLEQNLEALAKLDGMPADLSRFL
jgi:hypothetical protein|eukprot:COSAG01_NODE_11680_length_1881_cov_2.213805_2_plen_65_part_00